MRTTLLIIFSQYVYSVIIMEKSTGGFLKSNGFGPMRLVEKPENATIFKISRINQTPIHLSIREMGGLNSFDYMTESDELILTPFFNKPTQAFTLILDNNGVVQIF